MRLLLLLLAHVSSSAGFLPASNGWSRYNTGVSIQRHRGSTTSGKISMVGGSSALQMVKKPMLVTIPNPFKALPWNAQKERERQVRRFKVESSKLHRELGIAEDATYEEITAVTQSLIRKAEAEGDIKKKIKVEVAKDRILQLRLNERLAGLATLTKEARAQSRVEEDDLDDDDLLPDEKKKEWRVPRWAENLIVKPDVAYRNRQIKVFGILSFICLILPPLAGKVVMMNWMFAAGQIANRGMSTGSGDEDYNPYMRRGKPHQRTAILLSLAVWALLRIWTTMLGNIRMVFGPRYVVVVEAIIMNIALGIFTAYTQTYKK